MTRSRPVHGIGIARSEAATRRLAKLFRKLRVLLSRRVDPLIAVLKETEPVVFNEYRVARKLVNGPTASAEEQPNAVQAPNVSTPVAKAA